MTALRMLRVIAWAGVAAILVLSVVPGHDRPHLLTEGHGQYEHLMAYFVAGGALAMAYVRPYSRLALGVGLSAFAGVLEIAQLWIPGRDSKVIDWMAGSVGAWAAIAVVAIALRWRPWRHLQSRPSQ